MASYTVKVTVSGSSFHVNVTPKPPTGTIVRYAVTATAGTVSHSLDSGGGTQNSVYVAIASGTGGSASAYAPVAKSTSMVLFQEASFSKVADGSYVTKEAGSGLNDELQAKEKQAKSSEIRTPNKKQTHRHS